MRTRTPVRFFSYLVLLFSGACGQDGSDAGSGATGGASGSAGAATGGNGGTSGASGASGFSGAAGVGVAGSSGSGGSAGAAGSSGAAGAAGGPDDGLCSFQRGWARDVQGGLGGTIIPVTTLDREGPGSLAEALATTGPRVIVFEVGGVIDLALQSLRIKEPYVTVAGQTAPSPGITLIKGTLSISTHDVVVQHIRVRPGEADQSVGWEPDGISLVSAHDVIIDHCSVTWAIDENLSASGPRFEGATPDEWRENTSHRVTMSHNIVAEALSNSTHSKGEHSKGSLIHDNATEILIYGSLYASNVDRNPLFKGGARGAVVNNFIVNPKRYAITYGLVASEWGEEPYQTGMISIVGNVFHHGLDTLAGGAFFRASGGPVDVFLQDNVAQDLGGNPVDWLAGDLAQITELDTVAYWPDALSVLPSGDVLQNVLDEVGARPWDRDIVDSRIVDQALAGTSEQIDHEEEGGGYPQPSSTSSPFVPADWDDCFERVP